MKETGPQLLRDILGELFTARGWGRRQGRLQLEQIWEESVGADYVKYTRVAGLRRGVLEVEVANGVLLQELASYHKRRILQELRQRLPKTTLNDIRFRAGAFPPAEKG